MVDRSRENPGMPAKEWLSPAIANHNFDGRDIHRSGRNVYLLVLLNRFAAIGRHE
jgi:hypothetical protein